MSQRHPVANSEYLAWVEGDQVGVGIKTSGTKIIDASVVDRLTMDSQRVLVTKREDIDIHSDGFVLHRKGHQIWPSLWNGILLFREANQLMMYKMEE